MQVETFEAISLDEQNGAIVPEEVNEEALALIESLDLGGQRQLLTEREVEGQTVIVRSPYREITAEEIAILGTILPRRVRLEQYSDGPIPLRVLQVAAHAKEHFSVLEVWCPEKASDPDPLLVGHKGMRFHADDQTCILARWGEVLVPLEELRAKAQQILRAKARQGIAEARASLDKFAATVDADIDVMLNGGRAPSYAETITLSAQRRAWH